MPNSKRSSAGNDARATSNKRRQTRSTAATQETHSGSGGGSGVGSGGGGAQSIQFAKTAPVMPHGKLPDHLLAYVSNSTVSFDAYSLNFGSVPS